MQIHRVRREPVAMSCSNRLSALWIAGSFVIIFTSAVSGHSIRPTSISPGVHPVDPPTDHCSVVVKRCTRLGPAPYRPGCWHLKFEIVVQGQPLELVCRVAKRLGRDGLTRPRDLATLTAPGGATIPLAPNWITVYGPREEEFLHLLINPLFAEDRAIQLPNGEWSVQWWLSLICETKPNGAVTVTLDGPAILARVGYDNKASWTKALWTSAPATCPVPREPDPIKPNEPANIGAEIFTSATVGGVATNNVVVVSPTTVTAVTPAGSDGAATVVISGSKGTATAVGGFTYTTPWYTVLEQLPDPAVVTDIVLRDAIIATGLPWRVKDTGTNIEMLLIPPGSFTMGCTASGWFGYEHSDNENPRHTVTLTNAFYLGRYEVTQAQWTAKMGSNPSAFQGASYPNSATRPVEQVSWTTIASFNTATGMRLPTEAEWEYAYHAQPGTAGTRTAFHNGTNDAALLGNIAWYGSNSGYQTCAIGGKAANALGLHDMSGNVFEWCQDWYGLYSSASAMNPTGPPSGPNRVLRGGCWSGTSNGCRGSQRYYSTPDNALNYLGFRSARTP